ncbi:MAG: protease inhibitor I42 family protein [Legionellaceae bacterium]|nr:protease inhibitor I42 family protein [Legionellaceae bacterium]
MKILSAIVLAFGLCHLGNAETVVMTVAPGQSLFTVRLAANPTTGYQWSLLRYNQSLLHFESSQYIRPQNNRMGAGGSMEYTFRLKAVDWYPAQTRLEYRYARPWEKKSGQNQTVRVLFSK